MGVDVAATDGGVCARVACRLADDLAFVADADAAARFLGLDLSGGARVADLSGSVVRGRLPDVSVGHAEFLRVEAGVRLGHWRRATLSFLKLPEGWLLECIDATVAEIALLIDERLAATAPDDRASALVDVLAEALALRGVELALSDAGSVRRLAAFPPDAAPIPEEDAIGFDFPQSDGASIRLSIAAHAQDPSRSELIDCVARLDVGLAAAIREIHLRQALQAERGWTDAVLASLGEAVISVDDEDRIFRFGGAAEAMFGVRADRALGQPIDGLLAGGSASDRRSVLAPVLAPILAPAGAGDAPRLEALAEAADGTPFEVVVRRAAAAPDRTLVVEDVSGRRRAEAALERTRSQIVAILDTLRDAVFALDQDMTVVYANEAAGRLLERDPEHIVGAPVWESADALWDQLGPELFRCVRQREKQEMEFQWQPADRWFDVRILPTEVGASVFLLDVTDRRRASELQRENEARYRAVSELTTDLVFCYRVSASGMLVHEWTIGRASDVLGRELPEEVPPAGLLALVHPHDRTAGAAFTRSLLAGNDVTAEMRIIAPTGAIRWVEAHGKPERREGQGSVDRIMCAIRDISIRKRTETALRESEERFALAVEGAAEGLWDWDIRRGTVFRSEHLRWMLGVPAAEDIQRLGWWSAQVHPDDFGGYRAALRRHRESRDNLFAAEYRVRHRDGTWRWILDRAVSRRGADGRVERIVGAVTDISDRKNMELQLKAANAVIEEKNQQIQVALDNISQGLALFDGDGRLTLFNRRYLELYGLGDAVRPGVTRQALLEASVASGNYPEDEAATIVRRTLDAAGIDGQRHVVQRLVDGTTIEVTTTLLPGGGTVATYTDITPREQREQEMRAARDAAEAANRAKSAFLANMSHELRTPLNAVIGFSDVMKAEMFGPLGNAMYLSYVADIHASGQLLLDLINDILDISKIEAGKAEVAEEVFDLREVVEASLLLCREQAAASALALRARVAADLPRVRGDARYIRQILLNLVSNAVKFTPAGGRVTACVSRDADGGIVIAVGDTGIGIPKAMQARVFEPFFQVQSDLARRYQGTGLGLSLVKGLTELHGGRVEVSSRTYRGTIFRVRLPAYRNVLN